MANGIQPMLLLVEDNPDDRTFFLRAVKKAALPIVVTLAEQAIEILSRRPEQLFLILSDVHLPRRSGWDVLGWVRRQPGYLRLPFVLWTSQPEPGGERTAEEMGADSYLTKPDGVGDYQGVLSVIESRLRD